MWFESKIDSAPAELPMEGWAPEVPVETPAVEIPHVALGASPDPLTSMSPLADPGLAASMAGGASFSEPMQWLLVTAAGLFCAAVGQAVVISPSPTSAESNVEQAAIVDAIPAFAAGSIQTATTIVPAELGSRTETAVELKSRSIAVAERTTSAMLPVTATQQTKPTADAKASTTPTVHLVRKAQVATSSAKQVTKAPARCVKVTRTRRFGSRR